MSKCALAVKQDIQDKAKELLLKNNEALFIKTESKDLIETSHIGDRNMRLVHSAITNVNKTFGSMVASYSYDTNRVFIDPPKELVQSYMDSYTQEQLDPGTQLSLFQLETPTEIKEEPSATIDKTVKEWLTRMGVKVEHVNEIKDKNGNVIPAIAKADYIKGIIEIMENKSNINTLSEEAAHFLIEMMGDEHPLVKKMMNEITSYETYNEVKRDYYDKYKGDEVSLRKEAIGKMISKVIVQQLSSEQAGESAGKLASFFNWFKNIWNWAISKFKRLSSSEVDRAIDSFTEAANYITQQKVENLKSVSEIRDDKLSTGAQSEFYELETGEQERLIEAIQSTPVIPNPDGKGYVNTTNNKVIAKRVTDLVKDFYKKKFGKSDVEGEAMSLLAMKGTVLHKYIELMVNRFVAGKTITTADKLSMMNEVKESLKSDKDFSDKTDLFYELSDSQYLHLAKGVADIVDGIHRTQKRINPEGTAKVLTEVIIHDKVKDMAGTVDMMVIYSNGAVGIYDWKGINFLSYKGEVIQEISDTKKEAFGIQLGEYKRILKSIYDVKEFRESRVVPINMQLKYGDKAENGYYKLEIGESSNKDYLSQLPLAEEESEDKKLQDTILRQQALLDKLKAKLRADSSNSSLKIQINKLEKSIQKLLLHDDVSYVFAELSNLMTQLANRLGITDKTHPQYLTIADLNEYEEHLGIYENFDVNARDAIKRVKNEKERKELRDRVEKYAGFIKQARKDVMNKLADRLSELAGEDLLSTPGRGTGGLFVSMGEEDNPLFQFSHWLFVQSESLIMTKHKEATEDIMKYHDEFIKWARTHGKSGISAFDFILDKDGELIREVTKEFYEDFSKAIKNKDVEWLKAHRKFNKEKFTEAREKYIKTLESRYEEKELRERELKKFDRRYNAEAYDSAYLNARNWYLTPSVEGTKYESKEYAYMKQAGNEPLKAYYDNYRKYVDEFRDIVGKDKMSPYFIPQVQKGIIDSFAQNGVVNVKSLWRSAIDALAVRQNDQTFGYNGLIDPATSKPIPTIPIVYMDRIDGKSRSRDLTQSLVLMAHSVYHYEQMKEIEDAIIGVRSLMTQGLAKEVIQDQEGNVLKSKFTQAIAKTLKIPTSTIDSYDRYINMLLYGKKIQNQKTYRLNVGRKVDEEGNIVEPGTALSGTKAIKKAQAYLSKQLLMFKPVLAAGNYSNARAQMAMFKAEGIYFNKKMDATTRKLMRKGDKKLAALVNFFEISSRNMSFDRAKKASASFLVKHATADNAYILHRGWKGRFGFGDEDIDVNILGNMLQNYGLNEDGKVKALRKLPKGSKSLWDRASIIEDKVVVEGMTDKSFAEFRGRVKMLSGKIKGTISEEDAPLMSTYLLGDMASFLKRWIVPLAQTRFGALKYNRIMDEMEEGRLRVALGDIIGNGILPTITEFSKLMAEAISFGKYKRGASKSRALFYYKQYMNSHPDSKLTIEEYMQLRESKLRGTAMELRILFYLAAALGALTMAGAGDEDDDSLFSKVTYQITKRAYLEMSFFFDTSSFSNFVQKPFAVWKVVTDAGNILSNTVDETLDIVMGENSAKNQDKTGIMHYTLKATPGVSAVYDLVRGLDELEVAEEKALKKDKRKKVNQGMSRIIKGNTTE